ncbi:MAG TPA: glycosyltransferase [Chloroflexota bacterium]|nr:glycosyltransferase [Chloroflexota bacterium]
MRVLHVLEATIGGTKRHLLDLLPGLTEQGIHVEVACPRLRTEHHGDTSLWHDLHTLGIPTHELPMTRRPLSRPNLSALPTLTRLIRRGSFDVVHAQSSIAGALARPAAALSGRRPKVVYSPHGYAFLSAEWGRRATAFRLLERLLSRLTDRVIAVSDAEAQDAIRNGVVRGNQITVIPNGVVSADFPTQRQPIERLAPQLGAWSGAPLVGTIARMTPQKDPLTWLRLAARVRESLPAARFVWIWGGGALEQDVYDETDRLGLRQHVAFLGHRPDARQLLGALDVFLLTSRFEGLPYSVIEALAARTPVVATDVAGTRDVVKHGLTGLLAQPGAIAALAEHVLTLLRDQALARRLGAAGRADVLDRFSVEQMVDRTRQLYEQLVARGR